MCVRSSIHFYANFNLDMDRSPGFGSTHTDLSRPIKTWFPFGSVSLILNLACTCNSPDRSTKSTRFTFRCSTVCKHRVSGSFSLPSRGSFHLSITVLVRYRSYIIFSLGWWSSRIQSGFLVPRPTRNTIHKVSVVFAYAAFTLFDQVFKLVLLTTPIFYLTYR